MWNLEDIRESCEKSSVWFSPVAEDDEHWEPRKATRSKNGTAKSQIRSSIAHVRMNSKFSMMQWWREVGERPSEQCQQSKNTNIDNIDIPTKQMFMPVPGKEHVSCHRNSQFCNLDAGLYCLTQCQDDVKK